MFTDTHIDARVTCVPLPEFATSLPFPLGAITSLIATQHGEVW